MFVSHSCRDFKGEAQESREAPEAALQPPVEQLPTAETTSATEKKGEEEA